MESFREPLVAEASRDQKSCVTAAFDRLAQRFAEGVLRARFSDEVYQVFARDETTRKIAWPVFNLVTLMSSMVVVSGVALFQLYAMNSGLAPSCVAFEYRTSPYAIQTPNEWKKATFQYQEEFEKQGTDVSYQYVILTGRDSKNREVKFKDQLAPWNTDASTYEFPVFLTLTLENEISVSHVINDNVAAQFVNPLWLGLTFSSFWGWYHLPVLVPCFHVFQLATGALIVGSAAQALTSPPQVFPTMSEDKFQIAHRCSGNDQGLWTLTEILIFQLIVALLLVPAAAPVANSFRHLAKLSTMIQTTIKVDDESEDYGDNVCSICLDPLNCKTSSAEGTADKVWRLPCDHSFHRHCILPWLGHRMDKDADQSWGQAQVAWTPAGAQEQVSLGSCPQCRALH